MSASTPQLPAPVEDGVLGRYRLRARIASGGAGSVFAAEDACGGNEVVVKFIDAREDALGGWVKEMRIALRLVHPHIVRCRSVGYDQELQAWALIYDYATGGSLRRALIQHKGETETLAPTVLGQVGSALNYAHSQNVIHRDVKPENIVATPTDGGPTWKLTDFGDARHLLEGDSAESVVGSLTYMAPETFSGNTTRASDLYSLGVVGIEMLDGKIPTRRAIRDFARQHWRAPG
ncbi:MAG: serine/threonine-protein kinase, partial [Myxococcota bacterium]